MRPVTQTRARDGKPHAELSHGRRREDPRRQELHYSAQRRAVLAEEHVVVAVRGPLRRAGPLAAVLRPDATPEQRGRGHRRRLQLPPKLALCRAIGSARRPKAVEVNGVHRSDQLAIQVAQVPCARHDRSHTIRGQL